MLVALESKAGQGRSLSVEIRELWRIADWFLAGRSLERLLCVSFNAVRPSLALRFGLLHRYTS
jgi:hypothetical protein